LAISPTKPIAARAANIGLNVAESGGRMAGRGVSEIIGGLGTHTGGKSIRDAFKAGFDGGDVAESFKAYMRGERDIADSLADAKGALGNMRKQRAEAYRSGMADLSKDYTILDFGPIDDAIKETQKIGVFKDKVVDRSAVEAQNKINSIIDEWRSANPEEYHTPEGMDALKRTIGDLRDSTQIGTPERKIADRVYHAVRAQVAKQAPEYSKVMSGYESVSKQVKEIEKALSLGDKTSADTAMRKLQSLTRNNVSTNYGNRMRLAEQLERAGASNLLSDLSAQSLSSWTPRGIGKLVAGNTAVAGAYLHNPAAIPLLAAQSPRLVGETAMALGRGAGAMNALAYQPARGAVRSAAAAPINIRSLVPLSVLAGGNALNGEQ